MLFLAAVLALSAQSAPLVQPAPPHVERPVSIGHGRWAVPAVLTLPASSAARAPAVILLHGFGPGSVDADVGPNKLFKETADGLAPRGVATLRYAKRLSHHIEQYRALRRRPTVEEEWVEDAIAAVHLFKTTPGVDPDRIYVVGGSASAKLAPAVANLAGAAGAVMVNGANRPAGVMIKDQATYVESLEPAAKKDGPPSETLQGAERLIRNDEPDTAVVLGHPLWYWRSLGRWGDRYLGEVTTLTRRGGRVYVVQGARDYLTNDEDWRVFQRELAGKPGVTLQRFADLNHMMQPGEGRMTPAEYAWKKPTAESWLAALADWVKGDPSRGAGLSPA